MSKDYANLFSWLAKQDASKPHIQELIDLIGASVEAKQAAENFDRAMGIAEATMDKLRAASEELNKLKEERAILAEMLGTVSILDAVKELREIARSIPNDPPGLD